MVQFQHLKIFHLTNRKQHMKKSILLSLIVVLFNLGSTAQQWQSNLEQAKKMASKEDKQIILVFQGSDWCAPCMKLEREIWSSQEFIVYADKHFIMVKVDFPRKKKNQLSKEQETINNKLAEKFNPQGYFPMVVLLNKDEEVLGETGYKKMSPDEYIEHLKSFIQ